MNEIELYQTAPIDLGDKRLSKRYNKIVEALAKQPTDGIPTVFQIWKEIKAVYRFLSNPKVTLHKILEHLSQETLRHIQAIEDRVILLLQDTSDFVYNTHTSKEEFGPTHLYVQRGLRVHPTLAITSQRLCLGVLGAKMWTRDPNRPPAQKPLGQRPIEDKESYRWLEAFQLAKETADKCPDKVLFSIGDRESDIYELFLKAQESRTENLYFIVRAAYDRKTTTPEEKVKATLQKQDAIGQVTFLYKKAGQKHRTVTQTIRTQLVELSGPNPSKLAPLSLYALFAQEIQPPAGGKPIEWLMLTNYPVATLEDAQKILSYYTARWEIETFFKVLKTGCRVEEMRLATLERTLISLAVYFRVASYIMYLVRVGRLEPMQK